MIFECCLILFTAEVPSALTTCPLPTTEADWGGDKESTSDNAWTYIVTGCIGVPTHYNYGNCCSGHYSPCHYQQHCAGILGLGPKDCGQFPWGNADSLFLPFLHTVEELLCYTNGDSGFCFGLLSTV